MPAIWRQLITSQQTRIAVVEEEKHAIGAEYQGTKSGQTLRVLVFTRRRIPCKCIFVTNRSLAEKFVLSMYGISDARRIWKYAPKGSWVYDINMLGYKHKYY